MIAQDELDRVVLDEAQALWPQFGGKLATADTRGSFQDMLTDRVSRRIEAPVSINVMDQGSERWTIRALPLPNETEIRAREDAIAQAEIAFRNQQVAADKRRAAEHPSRAAVRREGEEVYVSISGMIEDLRHWKSPPDIWSEEEAGFTRALADVGRYLKTRQRRG